MTIVPFRYDPTAHSDQDNLRWCWLRSVEWGDWPLFMAQPVAPILLVYDFNYIGVVTSIMALNYLWMFVRYRFVSPLLADVGSDLVHLKWPISLFCGWLLWRTEATVPALLAGAWPLVTLLLNFVTPATQIGRIQRTFMLSLGYTRLDEPEGV